MKRNKLVAIFMVAIMAISTVGAFAGGVAASENVAFDGEEVSNYDQTNETVLPTDYSGENVTMRFTEPVEIPDRQIGEYSTQDGYIVDYEVIEYSGNGSIDPMDINNDGDFAIMANNGDVTIEEIEVTVAAHSIPFVVGSEGQSPVDGFAQSQAWVYSNVTDGERVALGAAHDEDFFLGVHETDENGDPITEDENGNFTALGTSAEMEAGGYYALNVDLDEELENSTELVNVLYNSDNGSVGEPVTDSSDNALTSDTWEPDIQDQLPSSDQLKDTLVSTPNGEEQAWNVYDPNKVVDTEVSVDNGEFNNSVYEPNETGEEAHFEVNITRNGTTYEDLDLSNLELTFSLDKNVFQDIEDVTELDSETLTLKEINEENSQKEYVFDVVQPNNATATYTLGLTATPTDASSTDAVSFGADIDPTGGPEVSDTESFEINEGADGAMFSGAFGIDDVGTLTAAVLSIVSVGLVGYVGYTKNVVGRIRNGDFGAEVFGIGAATVVVIVGAAEALSGTGIALTPAFDMVGYQAEQWVLGFVALAVAGLAAATTLDEDELPRR